MPPGLIKNSRRAKQKKIPRQVRNDRELRGGNKITVIFSFLLAIAVIVYGNRIFQLSPFFKNMVINLYIGHFLRALIILPFFLLWLEWSKKPKIMGVLNGFKNWWFNQRLAVVASLVFFSLITLFVAVCAYYKIPKGDAVWPFFQAKILAQGKLFAPAPPDFRFFATPTIVYHGKWFSYISPGHSVVILPFYFLGISWLAGPVLGTLGIWLIYRLLLDYTDARTARIALLLSVTSPFMIFLFASHEFHVTSIFFTVLALYSMGKQRLKSAHSCGWAFLAGLSLGMVFLARPYTALGVGIPLILFFIFKIRRYFLLFLLGGLIMVLIHLYYNWNLTGNWLTFPYQLMGKYHAIGFSPDYGAPTFNLAGHSLLKMFINFIYNLFVLSLQLFGWLFLSLIFMFPGIANAEFKKHWLFWAPALGLIVAYSFYWFHGITPWGPKYWSEALPAFILLSALGIRNVPALYKKIVTIRNDFSLRALPFLIFFCLVCYLPANFLYFSSGRWGEKPEVWQRVRSAKIHNAVVFVRTDERSGHFDYTSAFIFNDPFLKGDIIFPRDLGAEENFRFLQQFPDRSSYIYEYNTGTLIPLKR